MKKLVVCLLIVCLGIFLFGCMNDKDQSAQDKSAVISLVEQFGQKLQMVSLLAPADMVSQSMQEHYGEYVTPELLAKWQSDPQHAPGRLTSSPWPDRIEISDLTQTAKDSYEVQGQIIEITSVEQQQGGVAAQRPITLTIKKFADQWLITDVILGADEKSEALIYKNSQYGFTFSLPSSWHSYTIVDEQWEGLAVGGSEIVASGPQLLIRHPEWTEQTPRQDIPIMIFTQAQWQELQQEKFHIGAATMGPSELNRNDQYVFALPARYNYEFPTGYEEVENILQNNPLQVLNN